MKQLSRTCYVSDDNLVGCAASTDGRFAYIENDPTGIKILKVVNSLAEGKELVLDYEMAMKEFWAVFK
jgi:hypothetical protein